MKIAAITLKKSGESERNDKRYGKIVKVSIPILYGILPYMTKSARQMEVAVLLHDIRSTHNVGSIFRTCDALGVSKIYLSGYTPSPLDKFGRKRKDIAKVALGAEMSIDWEIAADPIKLMRRLKRGKYQIVGIEQSADSIDYKEAKIKTPVLFIVGNEVSGMDMKMLSLCDTVAEIPMKGGKESLNVSVAFGVALFRMLDA